jgi:hypothetical protein
MLPASSQPWNPATTAILPSSKASVRARESTVRMRARAKALSVSTLTWWPSRETALPPWAWMARASSPTVTCSPVEAMTSSSRSLGSAEICPASPSRRLVSPDMAETMTATLCPWRCVARQRRATFLIRSTDPTEVPPYF